jgi:hypothetical protein
MGTQAGTVLLAGLKRVDREQGSSLIVKWRAGNKIAPLASSVSSASSVRSFMSAARSRYFAVPSGMPSFRATCTYVRPS